jgi:methylated-DNA-[protein]-cysteine S-methyltransferase
MQYPSTSSWRWHVVETGLGAMSIAWTEGGVARVRLPDRDQEKLDAGRGELQEHDLAAALPPSIGALATLLRDYARGVPVDFSSVALDLGELPPTTAEIYAAARRIGWGHRTTYGDLAREIGDPRLARVVGHAMATNPVPILVPCHRVLPRGGRFVGGFSAPGGAATKERLLRLEGSWPPVRAPLLELMEGGQARPGR